LLDEEYFFSFEDIDFCLRAARVGFRVGCVQDSVAYHEGGRTIGRRSARRVYFATRNHLRLAARAGAPGGRFLRSGLVMGLSAAYVLRAPEAPLVRGLAAAARGAWHHFRGRYGAD
jgi:GT2 family glycosyltransferase